MDRDAVSQGLADPGFAYPCREHKHQGQQEKRCLACLPGLARSSFPPEVGESAQYQADGDQKPRHEGWSKVPGNLVLALRIEGAQVTARGQDGEDSQSIRYDEHQDARSRSRHLNVRLQFVSGLY